MPTESTFLFAGLLFLAAALGYVFARFGDDEDDDDGEQASRVNFLRGFRYLLNEEPDRAVDMFTGANELSEEALDTQLALGTLFRRRGEIDRAIRLHQNLLDRPAGSVAQREAASFALAEDYLSAGLFDRAEELLVRLRDSRVHGVDALRRLLRICEVTSDWDRAVDLCAELNRLAPGSASPAQMAHYYCELAEQARQSRSTETARQLLRQAEAIEPGKARTALIGADLDIDAGNGRAAIDALVRLGSSQPAALDEVVPRLIAVAASPGGSATAGPALRELAATPAGLRAIGLAVLRDPGISDPLMLRYLAEFVAHQPLLQALSGAVQPGTAAEGIARLRPLLHRLLVQEGRFQCGNCGYVSAARHWQCPGCRSWDTTQQLGPELLDVMAP